MLPPSRPHDDSLPVLPVLPDLPEGADEMPAHCREAWGHVDGELRHYHRCQSCGGWIGGQPNFASVDTPGPPARRSGTAFYCRRCGTEIAFLGR